MSVSITTIGTPVMGGGDSVAPVPVITSGSAATVYAPFSVTITFTDGPGGDPEDVTGFVVGDITVTNGSAGSFVAVSGSVYTATITPDSGAVTVTVSIAAEVCNDGAGNANVVASDLTRLSYILPTANMLWLWDARTGAYADTGLTTPSSDGGIIRGVKDDSANTYNVTQAGASTLCPTWRETVTQFNNQSAFEFDGGDYLSAALGAPILGNINTYTVYIVYRTSNSATTGYYWGEGVSTGNNPRVEAEISTTGVVRHFHSGAGGYTNYIGHASGLNDNTARLFTIRRNSSNFDMRSQTWLDNTTTVSPGDTTTTQIAFGAWLAAAVNGYFTGQIALIVAYSADNYATVEPAIQGIYGICDTYYDDVDNWYYTVGDSKTIGWVDPVLQCGGFGFQPTLDASLTTATGDTWRSIKPRSANGGYDCAAIQAVIDADLALVPSGQVPDWVLVNIGANDVDSLPTQASFESNLGYILDAIHTKWSGASVRVMYVWRRTFGANCDTLAGWIDNVLATRSSWAAAGPDERVFLENGDDGATYTNDGIHPNTAGNTLTAAQWQSTMGY